MEHLNEIIKQNYDIAIISALIAIFIAGLIFKKGKIFAIILLITAFYTLYTVAGYNKIKNINIKDIKNKVKQKVIDEIDS
jgi:Na+/H+ antiporter NhaC